MFVKVFLLAFAIVPSLVLAQDMFPEGGPVQILTKADFKKTLQEERSAVVMFFAPWCGHCKSFKPEYSNAAKALGPLIPFYAVDCDEDLNKPICAEYGIKGFPTVKTFPRGLKTPPHDYNGERKAKALVEFLNDDVPNRVTVIKGQEKIQPWVEKDPSIARALLITNKGRVPLQWKILQNKFNTKISFAAIKDMDGDVSKSFGIDSKKGQESVVLCWYVNAEQPIVYLGPKKYEALVDFLTEARDSGEKKPEDSETVKEVPIQQKPTETAATPTAAPTPTATAAATAEATETDKPRDREEL